MSAKGSNPGPPLLWAAALAALAPDAFAQTKIDEPPQPVSAGPVADDVGEDHPAAELLAACARWSVPLGDNEGAALPARAFVDETSSHALAVRYGAPLAPVTKAAAHDPWVEAGGEVLEDLEAVGAPLAASFDEVTPEDTSPEAALAQRDYSDMIAEAISLMALEAAAPVVLAAVREVQAVSPGQSPEELEALALMALEAPAPGTLAAVGETPAMTPETPGESYGALEALSLIALEGAAPVVLAAMGEVHAVTAATPAEGHEETASPPPSENAAEALASEAPVIVAVANDMAMPAPPPAPQAALTPVAEPAPAPLIALDAYEEEGEGDTGGEEIPVPDPLAPQDLRRRPGQEDNQPAAITVPVDPNAVAPPQYGDIQACESGHGDDHLRPCAVAIPDRWRLAENLGLIKPRWWDPYNQNTLKGDRPVPFLGEHWFFVGAAISDTIIEPRSFPTPMGVQTTDRAGSLDVFGNANSLLLAQTFILSGALIEGSTAFKPQDLEFRLTLAGNLNYAEVEERRILHVRPEDGTDRTDSFIGVQELFAEKHLRNVSERFDFDSVRVGIQPFSSDFRGFLFQDNQLGVRFFGTRNNNRFQYNAAAFARLEKDTNSGLNDVGEDVRRDYVFLANVYRQDTPVPGITSQLTAVYNMNREADEIAVDTNGFPARPALIGNLRGREYDVGYVGYNADGRLGRLNLTASAYYAFGEDRSNMFTGEDSVIRAYFVAAEPSMDFNWIRVRGSAMLASGDNNPYDDVEEGFDAIFENPQFAGADTSYWIRQSIPFAGGGRAVGVNGRNGVLPSLRSSKEEGQSNFINPGIVLLGAGADFDVLPELRLSTSVNHLSFVYTEPLQALRMQGDIPEEIGWDVSAAATYRPGFIQNFVFRLSGAALAPGDGFKALFDNNQGDDFYYSVLFNATLSY